MGDGDDDVEISVEGKQPANCIEQGRSMLRRGGLRLAVEADQCKFGAPHRHLMQLGQELAERGSAGFALVVTDAKLVFIVLVDVDVWLDGVGTLDPLGCQPK